MPRWKKVYRAIGTSVGVTMTLLAIADEPAQFATWAGWFRALSPHLHTDAFRWVLGVVGTLIALAPWIVEWCKPSISVLLLPSSGSRTQMDLRVTNTGARREFYAQCEFIALRHSPNPLAQVTYSLKWESVKGKRLFLGKGESANLLIARATQDHINAFAEMELLGLYGEEVKRYEWAGWETSSREVLPEFDLRISIFGDGTKKPLQRLYTLRPKTFHGPLEMLEISPEGAAV